MAMMPTPVQIVALLVLFTVFLSIPVLTKSIGATLDTLPMRLAAVIVLLAIIPYDKLIAIGLFLVIAGFYIQRHQDGIQSVLSVGSMRSGSGSGFPVDDMQDPAAMRLLHHGGHAAESHDMMDFMPKHTIQDNEFESVESINMKHALPTEPLGSKSQNLFGEDMRSAESLQRGNSDGAM